LAILASEAFGRAAPPVTILATDISNAALARAEAGSGYSERSVRNLSQRLRERYLLPERKSHFRVKDQLKALVRFRHHNLIEDSSPPPGEVPFDVVCCRNVLIYFDLPTVGQVLGSLETAARPGGRLILGAADRLSGTAGALGRAVTSPTVERRRVRRTRSLRRPLGLESGPRRRYEDRIEDALLAANEGDLDSAAEIVAELLAADPTLADAYFVCGLVKLESGDPQAAAASLRTALYLDPSFGLAAFELGRAHDANEDPKAARRAYGQALRSLDAADDRHRAILDQIDLGDVAAACAARLQSDHGATL
jgi:chemotaxis protein methyltransferase CheR